MGVLTKVKLEEGKTYGPIPPNLTLTDPTLMIGHMTSDSRPDVHTVKIDIHEYSSGARLGEWIPYVQAARDDQEQNMEALIQNGQLYYRVMHTIPAHSELLVWYSEDLARVVGVPQLNEVHYNDNGTYCCPYCAQNFRYPHSLRAHMRFKCDILKKAMHMDTPAFRSPFDYRVPYSMTCRSSSTVPSAINLSPSGSVTSTTSSLESPSPPRYTRTPDHLSDSDERPHKRQRSDTESDSAGERKNSPSPGNHRSPDDSEMRSAFRKVERHGADDRKHADLSPTSSSAYEKPSHISMYTSAPQPPAKTHSMPSTVGPLGSRFPMTMGVPSFISPLSVARLQNENIPINIAENNMKNSEYGRLGDKLMEIRNMENNNIYNKMGMYPPDRRMGYFPSQFFKSNNPMVDKIIHQNMHIPSSLTSFSLAQNWCAKCNTTFRMTSDLVYHMRSHHKQHMDPLKRKREEKLCCDTCGETFKERHHLSRHMTSHM